MVDISNSLIYNGVMIKIDLITGFLGSGKTTFIKLYAKYLIGKGYRVGIVVNDFGPVNIDRILLGELEGDNCSVEMVITGLNDDSQAHSRRFRTKLIALKMQDFNRVIVEPSGIYDIREFFDCLQDDPLYDWYESGNVITLVDADLENNLSYECEHYLASQLSAAGSVLFSKCDIVDEEKISDTKRRINEMLTKFSAARQLSDEIITKSFNDYDEKDWEKISTCGYLSEGRITPLPDAKTHFSSLFFTEFVVKSENELRDKISDLIKTDNIGRILRIKGFIKISDKTFELNASHDELRIEESSITLQQIVIVIGEKLDANRIAKMIKS